MESKGPIRGEGMHDALVLGVGVAPAISDAMRARANVTQLDEGRARKREQRNEASGTGARASRRVPRLTGMGPREIVAVALSEGLARMANRSTIQGSYPCEQ